MIDKLNLILQGLIYRTRDTGWKNLALNYDFKQYDDGGVTVSRYRRIGDVVYIVGSVSPKTPLTFEAIDGFQIAVLPEGYRPTKGSVITVHQGSGANIWSSRVAMGSGVFTAERYRTGGTYGQNVQTTAWFPFNISFATDEPFPE